MVGCTKLRTLTFQTGVTFCMLSKDYLNAWLRLEEDDGLGQLLKKSTLPVFCFKSGYI